MERLREGVELFNRSLFFEAHEAWEGIWLDCRGEAREFVKGLIQLAAAFHHLRRGNRRGAERLIRTSLERLDRFPSGYCGVERGEAASVAKAALEAESAAIPEPRLELRPDWSREAVPILE